MIPQRQRRDLNLQVGAVAYLVYDHRGTAYATITPLTITGECDEGRGYTAKSKKRQDMHTCNSFLAATIEDARAKALEVNQAALVIYREKVKEATEHVDYLEWVVAHPEDALTEEMP